MRPREVALVQAYVRDVTLSRFINDALRARPVSHVVKNPRQRRQLLLVIERRVVSQVLDDADRGAARFQPDLLFDVGVDDVVDAVAFGRARLAVADFGADQRLQFERDVFDDVAGPGSFAQPRDEAARHAFRAAVRVEAGDHLDQTVCEAIDQVRRFLFEVFKVDLQADDRAELVDVRAAIDLRL